MEKRTIQFNEEAHSYTDEYGKSYISTTQLIGLFEPDFDTEFWAMYRAIDQVLAYKPRPFPEQRKIELSFQGKRRRYSVSTLYEGIVPTIKTPQQIKQEWVDMTEDACAWGNFRHNYLEECINRFSKTSDDISLISGRIEEGFKYKISSAKELNASPLRYSFPTIYKRLLHAVETGWTIFAEKRVYSPIHRIAGTIDVLLLKGKHFHILDWKTNKKEILFKPGYYKKVWNDARTAKVKTSKFVKTYDKLAKPLDNLYSCKGTLYSLQLSLYAFICELWGLVCNGLTLCHIRPILDEYDQPREDDNGRRLEQEPKFYNIKYLKEDIAKVFEWRLRNMNAVAKA